MRLRSSLFSLALLFVCPLLSGINWKAVWLEPRMPVVLKQGESQPFKVMGLNGGDITAELTRNPYLRVESTDPSIVIVDKNYATLTGGKPGRTELRISFSEATAIVQVFVREVAESH